MRIQIARKSWVSFGIILLAAASIMACSDREPDSKVLAEVNDQEITQENLQAYLGIKSIPADQQEAADNALASLVERVALATKIEESSDLDAAAIDMEVAEFKRQLVISRYFEQYLNKAVSDDAIRNYYTSNVDRYVVSKARVAHILVRTNPQMSPTEKQAKLTTLSEAYSKINLGEDFAAVAKQTSEDKLSAAKDGDIGWVEKGDISKEFSEVVFNLAPGEVSKPFETAFGFHIVKLLEGPKEVTQSLDSVRGHIRYQLRNEAKRAETARLVEQSSIEIFK